MPYLQRNKVKQSIFAQNLSSLKRKNNLKKVCNTAKVALPLFHSKALEKNRNPKQKPLK